MKETASRFQAQAVPDVFPDLSKVRFIHTANDHDQIPAALLDDIPRSGPRELKTRLEAAIAIVSYENQSELNLASWRQTDCGGVPKARAIGLIPYVLP